MVRGEEIFNKSEAVPRRPPIHDNKVALTIPVLPLRLWMVAKSGFGVRDAFREF